MPSACRVGKDLAVVVIRKNTAHGRNVQTEQSLQKIAAFLPSRSACACRVPLDTSKELGQIRITYTTDGCEATDDIAVCDGGSALRVGPRTSSPRDSLVKKAFLNDLVSLAILYRSAEKISSAPFGQPESQKSSGTRIQTISGARPTKNQESLLFRVPKGRRPSLDENYTEAPTPRPARCFRIPWHVGPSARSGSFPPRGGTRNKTSIWYSGFELVRTCSLRHTIGVSAFQHMLIVSCVLHSAQ